MFVLVFSLLSIDCPIVISDESNLVGYWSFNEGTGIVAKDDSDSQKDGELYGPSWTNGIYGSALQFDGQNDHVKLPQLFSTAPSSLTVMAWINSPLLNDGQIIYNGYLGEFVLHHGDPVNHGSVKNGAFGVKLDKWYTVYSPSELNSNSWHHLAGVWVKGEGIKLYVDGLLVNELVDIPDSPLHNPGSRYTATIGSYYSVDRGIFKGIIDECRIYDTALNSYEIWSIAFGSTHNLEVNSVTPSSNTVREGDTVDVHVDISNTGDQSETFDAELRIHRNGESEYQIIETKTVILNNDYSTTISFNWDTSGFEAGPYTISAYAVPVLGEINVHDNLLNTSVIVTEKPTIIIDEAVTSDNRVDVGSTVTVNFHAKWDDGTQITNGVLSVNGTEHSIDSSGWISFESASNVVQQKTWTITGVNVNGLTTYTQNVDNPIVIWDKINIELLGDARVGVGEQATITYNCAYDFDETVFSGTIRLNDTILTQPTIGKRGYSVVGLTDDVHHLTDFTSNEIQVIFDEIKISTQTETLKPGTITVTVELNFASDNTPVESGEVSVNNIKCTQLDAGKYQTNLSSLMPYQSFDITIDVPQFSTLKTTGTVLPLGNIVMWGVIVAIVIVLLLFSNKMRIDKNRLSKLKKLVNEKGRVTVEEIAQVLNLDLDSAGKVLHDLAKQDDVDGSLTSDSKAFITSKRLEEELMREKDEKD